MAVKKSKDGMVSFYEGSHKYKHKTLGQLTSVTTLLSSYFKPFDAKAIAKMLGSFPVNKTQKRGMRYWLNEWKKSAEYGTLCHAELEAYHTNPEEGQILYPVFQERSQKMVDWTIKWLEKNPYYHPVPELLIYDEEYGVAGQVDIPIITKDKRVIIGDYKFTKKITKKGFKGQKGTHPLTEHLDDCKLITYGLQLSTYAYLLERQGYVIEGLVLIHSTPDGDVVPYEVPYMKEDVINILEDFKGNKE